MRVWKLIGRSLRYYWRTNLAVAAGVAVAVAVLVGSFLVGDSVKGSLRELALARLGDVDFALESPRPFRAALAEEVARDPDVADAIDLCTPAVILDGSATVDLYDRPTDEQRTITVPKVTVLGVEEAFTKLFDADGVTLTEGEVAISSELARRLHVREGDDINVSVARRDSSAPMETVFGRRDRERTVRKLPFRVGHILSDGGLERFSLRTDRPRPLNVIVRLADLQSKLWGPSGGDLANTLLVSAATDADVDFDNVLNRALAAALTLDDYDLTLTPNDKRGTLTLKSTRLVLSPEMVDAAIDAADDAGIASARSSIYLANSIVPVGKTRDEAEVPYAIVAGLDGDGDAAFATFERRDDGVLRTYRLRPGEIVLNDWAAEDLSVGRDDALNAVFYVADPRGELDNHTLRFKVVDVVCMKGAALDCDFVPEFEGMTDADDVGAWDPPFAIDESRILKRDEDYWDDHHTTPKAFVSLETLRGLWVPRGLPPNTGWVTSVRLASRGDAKGPPDEGRYRKALLARLSPRMIGLGFTPVRADALAATQTPTDFGVLFLSMSFFLVAAAAGLIWLLLRLTIDRRASQIGILLATGFTRVRAARVLVGEAMLVAVVGVIIGVPLGIAYAGGVIAALTSNWQGAVAAFPLTLHVTGASLVFGALAGLAVAAVAIVLSSRVLRGLSVLALLGGWRAIAAEARAGGGRVAALTTVTALVGAGVLLVMWGVFGVVSAAPAFMSSGALLLVGLLALAAAVLQRRATEGVSARRLSPGRLALRGASRHWVRSLLTVGLLACATLLIVTVAAFRKDPAKQHPGPKTSGTGGFNLLARTDIPIYAEMNTSDGRRRLRFSERASRAMSAARVYSFRESRGDDISCLNLQRPKAPRVIGVPPGAIARGGFAFSAREAGPENAWRLLNFERTDGAVPAFADAATAQWQLKVGLGDILTVPTPGGGSVTLRIAGLMPGSVFAGELLISEANFVRHFGGDGGYRFFLVACDTSVEEDVATALRGSLGEVGLEVTRTSDVLADYAGVQNTYLSAFETLGGLGLLLATFGIVTVLLRSVIERRAELAMMLAVGLRRRDVVGIVLVENALLLVLGVVIGTAAALVAAGPQLVSTVADVQWTSLAATLGVTVAIGLASCTVAATATIRGELVAALRSE